LSGDLAGRVGQERRRERCGERRPHLCRGGAGGQKHQARVNGFGHKSQNPAVIGPKRRSRKDRVRADENAIRPGFAQDPRETFQIGQGERSRDDRCDHRRAEFGGNGTRRLQGKNGGPGGHASAHIDVDEKVGQGEPEKWRL